MFTSSILAQDSDGGGGGSLSFLLILIAVPLVMYFLMIRPQRKRMRQQAEMQNAIGVGDEVITTSGVYGFITGVEDDKFWLEIDDDVQIRIAKAAVQGKVGGVAEPASDEADAKADKSIKTDDTKAKADKSKADKADADAADDTDTK
jgi:preprotein translocase subunit YajC